MTPVRGRSRSPLIALIGTCSTAIGLWLAFRFFTPELVGRLATVELVGLVGLIGLPGALWWLGVLERRMGRAV